MTTDEAENLNAEYLNMFVNVLGTEPNSNIHRIPSSIKMAYVLRREGIYSGTIPTDMFNRIWETAAVPKITYGIYLIAQTDERDKNWNNLEKVIFIGAMGCYNKRNRSRLLNIGEILILQQRRETQMTGLETRVL